MKTCSKCGLVKNESEFGRNCTTKDGLQGWCKKCKHTHQKEYRKTDAGKNALQKHQQSNSRKTTNRKYYLKHKEKNREKACARSAVYYAIKTGRLIKEPCFCGEVKVQAHHDDYSKPLDVEWLCSKHHIN